MDEAAQDLTNPRRTALAWLPDGSQENARCLRTSGLGRARSPVCNRAMSAGTPTSRGLELDAARTASATSSNIGPLAAMTRGLTGPEIDKRDRKAADEIDQLWLEIKSLLANQPTRPLAQEVA